jgi:hypothetical protein
MTIEAVGVISLILGTLCFFFGLMFAVHALVISTLFGASTAVVLTAMSNANVQPAHLLLGFFVAHLATRRNVWQHGLECLKFPRAGFWLLLTVIYGIVVTLLMPRFFAGLSYVYAIRSQGYILVPLEPSSGNVTQTIYFVADFICFVAFYAYASTSDGRRVIGYAALACAGVNLAFAMLDLVTYWTNTTEILRFIRNASYRMLNDTEVLGFKRIVGSFTEAASFAYATLGMFAFTGRLWLCGVLPRLTFALAALSLLALIFSTSTTAYVGLFVFFTIVYLDSLIRTCTNRVTSQMFAFIWASPVVISIFVIVLALNDAQWLYVHDLLEAMIFNKLSSGSGIERTAWNQQALTSFFDTFGFGAGVGSLRASSFPIAVLASIGVIGAITYGAFLICVLFVRPEWRRFSYFEDATQQAAQSACLAWLIAASVAGSFIDLGLAFFAFAGVACAEPISVPTSKHLSEVRFSTGRA